VSRVPQSTITSVHTRPKDGRKPGERSLDAYTTPTLDACVSRDTLRVRRPDGKDYKTTIVRVVRDVAYKPASETR
jgi:hypothetical protein